MPENEEKKLSKLEWLFYIVILPVLFTLVLAGVFMSFLGYDIAGTIRNAAMGVPILNQQISDGTDTESNGIGAQLQIESLKEEIDELKDEISKKQLEIDELTIALKERNNYVDKLEEEIKELKRQLEGKISDQKKWEDNIADLAQIYSEMSAGKAAPIITNLSEIEAIYILNAMNSENRAKILEKMSADKAASLTSLLTARSDTESQDVAVLLAKIEQLNSQLDDKNKREIRTRELAKLYAQLDDAKAAGILSQMSEQEAADILVFLSEAKRLQIIENMNTNKAAKISQLLIK